MEATKQFLSIRRLRQTSSSIIVSTIVAIRYGINFSSNCFSPLLDIHNSSLSNKLSNVLTATSLTSESRCADFDFHKFSSYFPGST